MDDTTYNVRVYSTRVYNGAKVTTYYVRWRVDGQDWTEPFRQSTQASNFRGRLAIAASEGEAFSRATGRPVSWQRDEKAMTWYDFACAFVDMKWPTASPKYRRDIARALTAATTAMLDSERGRPDECTLRYALHRWGFNTKQRSDVPADTAHALAWVARHTLNVSALAEPAVARRLLTVATTLTNGKPAAASTAKRHRTILGNAMDYAQELNLLDSNPIRALKWTPPKVSGAIDKRRVVNPRQAGALLEAVRAQQPSGPRLVAFFGVLYYAALRPEEAIILSKADVTIPPLIRNPETGEWEEPPYDEDWGELHFHTASPDVGPDWTDDGAARDTRQLKHRAVGDSRTVPAAPPLTRILRAHLQDFGTGPGGRLFTGVRTSELPTITYRRAWKAARIATFTAAEQASPLAGRPYDLRHACLSTWLNGGVPATQVAEWAGHSVEVLLRIYAKCLDGHDEFAKRRIADALRETSPHHEPSTSDGPDRPGDEPHDD